MISVIMIKTALHLLSVSRQWQPCESFIHILEDVIHYALVYNAC